MKVSSIQASAFTFSSSSFISRMDLNVTPCQNLTSANSCCWLMMSTSIWTVSQGMILELHKLRMMYYSVMTQASAPTCIRS